MQEPYFQKYKADTLNICYSLLMFAAVVVGFGLDAFGWHNTANTAFNVAGFSFAALAMNISFVVVIEWFRKGF